MSKERLFNYLKDAQFIWQGPLDEIANKTKELTGIDLSLSGSWEGARDNNTTLLKIGRHLIGYHQKDSLTGHKYTGSIHRIKLSQLCTKQNQIWVEDDALPEDGERVHEAYLRLTKQKLSTINCVEKEEAGDGTFYLFKIEQLDVIVFLSYPGNNYIYKL